MANALETVYSVLTGAAPVTSVVGTRFGPLTRPQALTVPAITYQRIVTTPQNHLRGNGALNANLVQLDVWAATYAAAVSLAGAVRSALEAAGHVMSDERDDFDPAVDPDLYRIIQGWQVWT